MEDAATGSDFWTDSSDSDGDYYADNDLDEECEGADIHPVLEEDIERVKRSYGSSSISTRMFGSIDDLDVDLVIPLTFLNDEMARAWKVIPDQPLVIRLHLSMSQYLNANEPAVEVYQSKTEKCGIGSQMCKILKNFISENWRKMSNSSVKEEVSRGRASTKPVLQSQISRDEVSDEAVCHIMEMGFTAEMARSSLSLSGGSINQAIELLFACPESFREPPVETKPLKQSSSPSGAPPPLPPPRTKHTSRSSGRGPDRCQQSSTSAGHSVRGKLQSLGSKVKAALGSAILRSPKDHKSVPGLELGFLVQLLRYIKQRLPTLCEYCVVCDEPHLYNTSMLKPAVCGRDLCVFAFQTLGVMSDAADDIAASSEVVTLLVHMAHAACKSNRRDMIFDPYPTVVDPRNPTLLAFNPQVKDYRGVESCLEMLCDMEEGPAVELVKRLNAQDVLAYPLLQWIVASNRSHIVLLPPAKRIAEMCTEHQFLLMSSPPARDAIFREARSKYGSEFAFHGSHIENWHSIMRQGLINASGTKLQVNGAAYGAGVYLSPLAQVSFNYSGLSTISQKGTASPSKPSTTGGKKQYLNSKNLVCIALCEVISSPGLKKSNQIWVMPNADYVCTRFFFVYEAGMEGDSSIDTRQEKYRRAIQRAIHR